MKKIFSLLLIALLISLSACTNDSQVSTVQAAAEASAISQTMSAADLAAQEAKKANKYAWSADGNYTGRTRIENGVLTEWAEEYPMDKTNKPIRYEKTDDGLGHRLFYNVDGQEIKVVVDDEEGYHKNARLFYEEGKTNNFAEVQVSDKSNEAVFKSVAANRKLNELIEEKYR